MMPFRRIMDWPRGRKVAASVLVMLTLAVGIVIGSVVSGRVSATREQNGGEGAALLAVPSAQQLSGVFASIAKSVEPAIVNISTTQIIERRTPRQRRPRVPDEFEFPFERFFGPFEEGPSAARSLGSGVIVDKSGYILTNNHVVEQATKIEVRLADRNERYSAKVVGSDYETDLAVIKIEPTSALPVAKLGNSDGVQVGDWVLAFGSPFGLQATVTAGIVSAKDRANLTAQQFQRFIQTDAAINPGNSGGALVNLAGEVIGINTAIATARGGYDGVGFALPSNTAIEVYNDLIKFGRVTRGSIGVTFNEDRSTNDIVLEALGVEHGIILESVEPGSPADKAGLQAEDVVTAVNGKAVRTGTDLVDPITHTAIGENVRITFVRNKVKKETQVSVADRAKLFPETASREEEPEETGPAVMGLRVEELTPQIMRQLSMEGRSGVVVSQVEPGSFAEDIGFIRGDVVSEVNGQPVASVAQFSRAIDKLEQRQDVMFKVHRRGQDRSLTLFLAGRFEK